MTTELRDEAKTLVDRLHEAYANDVASLEKDMEEVEEEVKELKAERDDLQEELARGPEWGNCVRGCPPAFLDRLGFCSPACAKGAHRGEYVTLPKELVVGGGEATGD